MTTRLITTLLATYPDGVARSSQLRSAGISGSAIQQRCRPGGPWTRPLPGVVVLTATRVPRRRQQLRAALTYAGADAIVTGLDALHAHGLAPPPDDAPVHLLLPAHRKVASRAFVLTERTTRLPQSTARPIPVAPPVRAVLDAARREPDPARVRDLLTSAISLGHPPRALRAELDAGSQRGAGVPRAVLAGLSTHVHVITEGWARRIVANSPVPAPQWQVPVHEDGQLLAVVNTWWPEVRLAWQNGTHGAGEHHDELAGAHRDDVLRSRGITVVRTPLARLHDDPTGLRRTLTHAYHQAWSTCRHPALGGAG